MSDLLTVPEVAARLRVKRDWVYDHKHELGCIAVGRVLRFTEQGLAAYLERQRMKAPAPGRVPAKPGPKRKRSGAGVELLPVRR